MSINPLRGSARSSPALPPVSAWRLRLAQEGAHLVLVARSRPRLEEVAADLSARFGVSASVVPGDLADPAAPAEIFAEVAGGGLAVDVLVNNAGFATYGHFAELDLAKELEMVRVNALALTHLTHLFSGIEFLAGMWTLAALRARG